MYYAVKVGRERGIYKTWDQCKEQVMGFKNAVYKKFKTLEEAQAFINSSNENLKEDVSLKSFEDLKENEMVAYVDGSYRDEDKSYSYGVYLRDRKIKEEYSKRFFDEDASFRNVAGELKGAILAMKRAVELKKDKIYIHYDYRGIEDWALGNWQTNKSLTKEYKAFYDNIKESLEVVFIKVKSHKGVELNEYVDKLAKEAIWENLGINILWT